ncbi:MAG: electron transfer flavoprotein subunit beta/FixA family protein [Bacillota bacterium]
MNILVLVKPVPDPEHEREIRIDAANGRLVRDGVPTVIDPESRNALEAALQLREKSGGGAVAVLAMAPEQTKDKLTEALAMGADEGYMLSDRAFGGADTYATSYTLAQAVRKIEEEKGSPFELVLAGTSSSDGGTSHVAVQTAEWLGRTHISNVCSLDVNGGVISAVKRSEEVMLTFEGEEPAVIGVTRDINKPRFVTAMGIIKARKKPLTIWSAEDLGIDTGRTGLEGSPTRPGRMFEPDQSRAGEVIGDSPEAAAAGILQIVRKAGL